MRVTTNGPPPAAALPLRTVSGRDAYDGDTVTPDDPIVLPAVDGTGGTLTIGVASRSAPWWNNIRRAWMTGPADAPVMVDPQPPPFGTGSLAEASAIMREAAPDIRRHALGYAGRITPALGTIPPAVKVTA